MSLETMPPQEHWSKKNLREALEELDTLERPPKFGPDGDTGEKDGKYYAMGREVEKDEFDFFMKKFDEIIEHSKKEEDQDENFKKAA